MLSTVVLAACGGIGGYTQPAGLFPLGTIYTETTSGSDILENGSTASKEGKACGTVILGMIGTGDTSVETAMKNGGIKKVVFVTQKLKMIFWSLYGEVCTVARGN
jgi:hypothetical protein